MNPRGRMEILLVGILAAANLLSSIKCEPDELSGAASKKHGASGYNIPFLVLLSEDEVSVAQLPLIENGNVSAIYRLPAGEADPWEEEDDDSVAKEADARKHEQMPAVSSASLGKSEWRPIPDQRPSSVPASGQSREQEVGVRSEDGADASGQGEGGAKRLRRGKELGGSGEQIDSNASRESQSSKPANVTSARFGGNERPNLRAAQTASSVAGGPKNGVHFSDFDVHMSLGYAFVVDSLGRIHRLRLSGFVVGAPGNSSSLENNYSNTITAATSETSANFVSSSPTGDASDTGGPAPSSVGDDANANHNSALVTQEQSGTHPSASGDSHTLQRNGASESLSSPSLLADNQSGGQRAHKSAIIWARTKHNRSPSPRVSREHNSGAFPNKESDDHDDGNRWAYEREALSEQMEGADQQQVPPEHSDARTIGEQSTCGQRASIRDSHRQPGAEIAVDWLNNLLFLLDRCRLVVMDLEGNNELLLIDDFNVNNRPIDIKVDPVNDFLFWLQLGKFHNTIYKLDLKVLAVPTAAERLVANTLKLSRTARGSAVVQSNEPMAIISHHYAHPIITNLPRYARVFNIDHKHSRIYVPLAYSLITSDAPLEDSTTNLSQDAEVFATNDESTLITHMNSTSGNEADPSDENCSRRNTSSAVGQVLAYNLDGTDVGPFRDGGERSQPSRPINMLDMTLDSGEGLLYWLVNGGKDLLEEYRVESERESAIYSAQHSIDGKRYLKLAHFDLDSNQPRHSKSRYNLRKLIHMSAAYFYPNRWVRSGGRDHSDEASLASRLRGRHQAEGESDPPNLYGIAPYFLPGIGCLLFICVYLVYTFIFRNVDHVSRDDGQVGAASLGLSLSGSQTDCDTSVRSTGLTCASAMPTWMTSPPIYSNGAPTLSRDFREIEGLESGDVESNNYNASNAIDDHYRAVSDCLASSDCGPNRLANLSEWPPNLHDMSNKLYIPVEVLKDEKLSSINRISIDQLEIERRAPLGEGHFGTVLQGTVTYDEGGRLLPAGKSQVAVDRATMLIDNSSFVSIIDATQARKAPAKSFTSSGHGSSSTSSEFVTSADRGSPNGDYLVPRSHYDSAVSDCTDEPTCSSWPENYNGDRQRGAPPEVCDYSRSISKVSRKFKVAIKKLRDNASAEEKRDFLQEAKLLANFDHPNIVHLIGICLDRGSTLIVMELMLGGDLIRYMQENMPRSATDGNLTDDDLISICLDIASGCCYLEELNYIHRDLAARNCLVSSRKKEDRVVKLADFGLARDIYKDSYYKKLNDSAMPLKWMAPECLIEQKFTTMSDVWSFGVVLWEVMSYCQEKPYGNIEPFFMKEHLTGGARLEKPKGCSDEIYKLMNECWQLNPNDRPTFQECRATLIEIKNGWMR